MKEKISKKNVKLNKSFIKWKKKRDHFTCFIMNKKKTKTNIICMIHEKQSL